MILVTVGTHNQGFDRLVRAMDEVAAGLDEQVIIQYGSSGYVPEHADHFQWATSQEMQALTRQARVVVCHAAAGAILTGLLEGKPLVIVPRLKAFGEVVDDHQLQLAGALDQAGRAVEVKDPTADALGAAISRVVELASVGKVAQPLICALQNRLESWATAGPRQGAR